MKNIKYSAFIFCLLFSFYLINPSKTFAADKCSFTRDLELGMTGEDIRCLQKYLNSSGYIIASTGVGSVGHETNQLKDLTKKAIKKWQSDNGLSATGYFGPLSRQKYESLIVGNSDSSTTSSYSNEAVEMLKTKITSLTSELSTLQSSGSILSDDAKAKDAIK